MYQTLLAHDSEKKYNHLYTDIHTAREELERRRTLQELMAVIHDDLKLTPELHPLALQPNAVIFRQIATPIHEVLYTLKRARTERLMPFILEYHKDKFVSTGNTFKRGLGKLPVASYEWEEHSCAYEHQTIVDFNTQIGKPLDEVMTLSGEPLVSIHHQLFEYMTGTHPLHMSGDGSSWFQQWGNARTYYTQLLKLFICDGILFENFITSPSEEKFVEEVVHPAFIEVTATYGLAPLVVRIAPEHEENRHYWNCYPKDVDAFFKRKRYS